jgi:hypothetical protein
MAEYRPLADDGNNDSTPTNRLNTTSDIPNEHRLSHSDDTIDLLPHRDQSFETQSFITTINVREGYEQQYGTASHFSCVINLANTILGTGMLAMVYNLYFIKHFISLLNIIFYISLQLWPQLVFYRVLY